LAAARQILPSLLMVLVTRVALTFWSLARLRQWLLPVSTLDYHDLVEVGRVAWSVWFVAHFVPFASCLTKAQACQILLARRGIASTLCLGVREGNSGALEAHAWLICEDRLVLGGEEGRVPSYRRLADLGPVR
jgi:hypothetical protein